MKTIGVDKLIQLAFLNSPKMPTVVNDEGVRKQWVGIGWVSEGPADGTECRVIRKRVKSK